MPVIYQSKNSPYYRVKFRWQGKLINVGTKMTNQQDARLVEANLRSELAKERWGILAPKPKPDLSSFLKEEFLPYARTKHAATPKTLMYYEHGAAMLSKAAIGKEAIDKITDKENLRFVEYKLETLKPSSVNCGVRTLRVALGIAERFGHIIKAPRLSLAKGEAQRERVLTEAEDELYLAHCPQPWRDCAVLLLATGMRPSEAFCLRWEQVAFQGHERTVRVLNGKTKAARRVIPLLPKACAMLKARFEAQGKPKEGWVFPSESSEGHLEQGTAKTQHASALKGSKLKNFPPYTMRHTALTRFGGFIPLPDLKQLAGHTSIQTTLRYVHGQPESVKVGIAKLLASQSRQKRKSRKRKQGLSLVKGGDGNKKYA